MKKKCIPKNEEPLKCFDLSFALKSIFPTILALKENMNVIFPNFTDYVTLTDPYVYPTAVAFWPVALKRSRFDDLSKLLRAPFGRVFIGGDTTDSSHADGAVDAALRMSKELEELLKNKAKNEKMSTVKSAS